VILALLPLFAPAVYSAEPAKFIAKLKAGQKLQIVTYGTSLTANGTWPELLKQALDAKYPKLVSLTNSGQSGMHSKWGMDNLDKRVIASKPDVVFIEFGINDAAKKFETTPALARENLVNMIGRIEKALPQCEIILLTMNPATGDGAARRNKVDDYYDVYRAAAKDRKLRLADLNVAWKPIVEKPELWRKYVPDGLHPNKEGTENVILPALLQALTGTVGK
jgi:lysophospholipase L1-like esterase